MSKTPHVSLIEPFNSRGEWVTSSTYRKEPVHFLLKQSEEAQLRALSADEIADLLLLTARMVGNANYVALGTGCKKEILDAALSRLARHALRHSQANSILLRMAVKLADMHQPERGPCEKIKLLGLLRNHGIPADRLSVNRDALAKGGVDLSLLNCDNEPALLARFAHLKTQKITGGSPRAFILAHATAIRVLREIEEEMRSSGAETHSRFPEYYRENPIQMLDALRQKIEQAGNRAHGLFPTRLQQLTGLLLRRERPEEKFVRQAQRAAYLIR